MENEDSKSRPSVSQLDPIESKILLTPKQREAQALVQSGRRHVLLVGGARSGKTTLLVNEIAQRAVNFGNSRHVILRYRFNAVRPSIALDTLPKVFQLGFPQVQLRKHRTDGYFSLENGSEIWFGGLDDHERVEKILGKEYATILFNECSQIAYSSILVALTRLAQVVDGLQQAAYYDLNPTNKGHWSNVLFGDKRDPVSRQPLDDPDDYALMFLNPRDNPNLTAAYLKSLERLPERARKRFYEGAYVDDLDGALFSYEVIARTRLTELPIERRTRVVVAVDPSGARGEDDERRDEIGIVVAALGDDKHAYVLADRSLRDGPMVWGGAVVQACRDFATEQIVAEENFGGDMVRHVIHTANPNVKVQMVSASRGKVLRAEPVSALYEQGKVHHVGRFAVLEDQLCAFTTSGYRGEGSPDHADALVFAISELMLKESAPLLEYYRRLAQDRERDQVAEPVRQAPEQRAPEGVRAAAAESVVWLKAPEGISGAHGRSGAFYCVDGKGLIAVKSTDASGLIAHGFGQVA
jgi:phage terminase large subunit-like protein